MSTTPSHNGKSAQTSSQPLIHLSDVKKVFYTDEVETHALSGIHLDINKGEYVSIAGPSGCGKSTLLSILGLLDTPTDGEYVLNDHPVENLSHVGARAYSKSRSRFHFQSFNLIGDLTVYENVELPLTYRGMSSGERKKRTTEALERVGMAHRAKHFRVSCPAVNSNVLLSHGLSVAHRASCWQTSRPEISIQPTAKR